jgi:signal transduction histidine kinase
MTPEQAWPGTEQASTCAVAALANPGLRQLDTCMIVGIPREDQMSKDRVAVRLAPPSRTVTAASPDCGFAHEGEEIEAALDGIFIANFLKGKVVAEDVEPNRLGRLDCRCLRGFVEAGNMSRSSALQWSRRSAFVNGAVAVLSVAVALVAALLLEPRMHSSPFVSLSLCAVMFSAWFGGLGPGLLATVLSVAGFTYYFVPPVNSFAVVATDFPRIVLLTVTGLFVVWLNVSRRGAEGALGRSEAYLAEAQQLSHTGSFGWKVASGDLVWSKQTYQIFGVDETVKPTIDLVLQRVHPDDQELVRREIAGAAQGGQDYEYEHRLLMPNGAIKHLHVRAHRVKYQSGAEEIVGALTDVTATREAQEASHTAHAELARVSRVTALAQMSASIAHEVNQPLAAIATNAAAGLRWLTREVPEVDEARACVSHVLEEANRAGEVIRSVRDLARRADPELVPVDINEVIDEAVALLKPDTLTHCVTVRLQLASGLPLVRGDRVRLQQVIINLAINGVQAMATVTGRARVLTIRTEQRESDQVLVAVQDVGIGTGPEDLDQLFSAFYTTKPDGMGMGLSISRSIIEAHGGQVWASRNIGSGMTFQFAVPAYGSRCPL